tara:strand:- start:6902 stop:7312 length:411 start_codon:yes stop_codon:yes gene_type:complete
MQKLLLGLLFLPVFLFSQFTLTVHVGNVKTSSGNISIAVYDNEQGFLEFDHVLKSNTGKAKKGITTVELSDLPQGLYALAVFHDENENGHLDTNFLGIPKEAVGFSNAKMKTFGPPSYKECSFLVDSNKDLTVNFK